MGGRELAGFVDCFGCGGAEGQPSPGAHGVCGHEQWAGRHPRGLAHISHETLQPGQFVAVAAGIGVPRHDRKMMPAQRIANGRRRCVDVNRCLGGQNLAHTQRTKAVLILQPALALVLVHFDDLL
jgi:hypothetical protein